MLISFMESFCNEFFGPSQQQELQRRADLVWALLKDDPSYACHGRAVALANATDENIDAQIALARLQGVGAVEGVSLDAAPTRREALEKRGMNIDQFVVWRGGPEALAAADDIARSRSLASDLEIVSVDEQTSFEDLSKLDALTQSCGVLLPMGAFIRGYRRPSVCLFALDKNGNVVGATASIAQFHHDHPKGDRVWWGMLATDNARRGEGIALIMGAHSMLAMREHYGYKIFFTGIREGNAPSEELCRKLGLTPTKSVVMIAIDPKVFSAGRVTK